MATKWHYTTLMQWKQIRASGLIMPATAGVPQWERPAVWFSTNQEWEPTAAKGIINPKTGEDRDATREEMVADFGGLVRIGVADEIAPHDWHAFKARSGVQSDMARALYQVALEKGAKVGEWFVTFGPVAFYRWTAVEIWTPDGWRPMPDWHREIATEPHEEDYGSGLWGLTFPLAAFIGHQEPGRIDPNLAMLPLLHDANIILGHDTMSGREFVVYGRVALEAIAGGEQIEQRLLCIEVDQGEESDDLEMMLEMVQVVKGRHEYVAYGESEPQHDWNDET